MPVLFVQLRFVLLRITGSTVLILWYISKTELIWVPWQEAVTLYGEILILKKKPFWHCCLIFFFLLVVLMSFYHLNWCFLENYKIITNNFFWTTSRCHRQMLKCILIILFFCHIVDCISWAIIYFILQFNCIPLTIASVFPL